ncbi:MAG: NAD(P)H-dependent oxidoreductase [Fusobacteriaceae bacterium]|nr:NAD(P)H-dependent oxidoreductase [Fusobacteriaceae bacterium]MBN2838359.1 NAD(P)H-dependent oxidoreductase [Fusobacteriaceae bacterium]
MKITVLNGSPKGKVSVTYNHYLFIKKQNKDIEFEEFDVAQQINSYENISEKIEEVIDSIKKSQAVFWITPVYHFTVPGQLKRFIELLFEYTDADLFKGKYATLLTTSIHFYDNMAENYIWEISEDLGMQYVKGFLAEMHDLLKTKEQNMLIQFFNNFKRVFLTDISQTKRSVKLIKNKFRYDLEKSVSVAKSKAKKILVITDYTAKDINLKNMINKFGRELKYDLEIINLNEIKIQGGCLGCIKCGFAGECVYNDDLIDIYKNKMPKADAIVMAVKVKDRYFTSGIKIFYDRSFINGHRPMNQGKHLVYLVSGELSQIVNLREEIQARSEVSKMNLVDVISDEVDNSAEMNERLKNAAKSLEYFIENNITVQSAFYYISGQKIFRDFIYRSRGIFKADHDYYKKIGYYDFANRNKLTAFIGNLLGILLINKKIRSEFLKRVREGMIMKHKKVIEKLG